MPEQPCMYWPAHTSHGSKASHRKRFEFNCVFSADPFKTETSCSIYFSRELGANFQHGGRKPTPSATGLAHRQNLLSRKRPTFVNAAHATSQAASLHRITEALS